MAISLPVPRDRVRAAVNRRLQQASPLLDKVFNADLPTDLARARQLAIFLDSQFGVGNYRFGFETIFGAIPVVGDTLGAVLGLYPIYIARKHRLGKWVQLRMGLNLGVEWLVGAVPMLGDAFDTVMKANLRNLRLLEQAAARKPG